MIFTKLQPSTGKRWDKVMYKIDSRADGNLIPLKIFKFLFPKSTTESLHAIKIVQ